MALIGLAVLAAPAMGQDNTTPARTDSGQTTPDPASREISGLDAYPERLIPAWVRSFGGLPAFTQPSRDATMGFTFSVEIAEVLARVGSRVSAGDLLIRASDEMAVAASEAAQAQAENDAEIKLWEATERLAQIELDNLREAQEKHGAITPAEMDAKETELEVAKRRVENARIQQQLARIQARVRQAEVDRYRLTAPFDGEIAKVDTEVGAIVRETEPVLRIINRDTIRIRVDMPERDARRMKLRVGDPAWVVVDDPDHPTVYVGRITEVSPDVVFGAKVLPLWVEVPNPDGLVTGLSAWVRFGEPTGEWSQRIHGKTGDVEGAGLEAIGDALARSEDGR